MTPLDLYLCQSDFSKYNDTYKHIFIYYPHIMQLYYFNTMLKFIDNYTLGIKVINTFKENRKKEEILLHLLEQFVRVTKVNLRRGAESWVRKQSERSAFILDFETVNKKILLMYQFQNGKTLKFKLLTFIALFFNILSFLCNSWIKKTQIFQRSEISVNKNQ